MLKRGVGIVSLMAVLTGLAVGQPASPAPSQPQQPEDGKQQLPTMGEVTMRAAYALGERVVLIRSQVSILPTLVIVPDDATSYVEAVSHWNPKLRFPVLIDDGSPRAAEDIARFVRAFKPTSVVRWTASKDRPRAEGEPERLPDGIPEHHPKKLQALVEHALGRAWVYDKPVSDLKAFCEYLKSLNLTPPGIVLCNPEDPAWVAGLALAAGHGQPIAWVKAPQAAGGTMNTQQAETVAKAAEDACMATGLKYDAVGDEIDSVALCMNVPAKFTFGQGEKMGMVATTDVVGRRLFTKAGDSAQRWGWSSVVWGTRPRAAYMAMCSLFLAVDRAWIFDGYADEGAFKAFDGTKAGELLAKKPGLTVEVDDKPKQGDAAWRERAGDSVNAGLIMVNTMGNADFFDVKPGRLKPADVPLLDVPAAVHFVHSWSAADVNAGGTVAGRWFNHGVFAYLGSVQEPFLHAFVPTPVVAARLLGNFPWAAAVRVETGPIWKIACFGDPLWTLSATGPRAPETEKLALEGATPLTDSLRDDLKAGKLAEAARTLVLLGQDKNVARLTDSTLSEKPALVTSDFVAAVLPALHRAERTDLVIDCYGKLDNQPSADEYLRDVLWAACSKDVMTSPTNTMLSVLSRNIRIDNRERDEAIVNAARSKVK